MKNVLILGVNGFIGHHLSKALLSSGGFQVHGLDTMNDRVADLMGQKGFNFFEGDVLINREWIEYHVKKCDVILPLVAIAVPTVYVTDPLRVFELDFESNLEIVRHCVKYKKRLIFPSTSEIYGMSKDAAFHPYESDLVYGPIEKQRWIYACSKQLLDRVIYAYGEHQGLDYTLFRPFNWVGPGLDNMDTPKEGASRVLTQFLGEIVRGENIRLVDGGHQKRCFTYIEDGIAALMKIIENKDGVASKKIYNIGHPENNVSVRQLAEMMLTSARSREAYKTNAMKTQLIEQKAEQYYGKGFQDVQNRVPWIENTMNELKWAPKFTLKQAIDLTLDFYEKRVSSAQELKS